MWLTVVVVAAVIVLASALAYYAIVAATPCVPPGGLASGWSKVCPAPPPPGPTTFIANGTVYTLSAGGMSFFQFRLSPATLAILTGSFTATQRANVSVMIPGDFANLTAEGAANYRCPPIDCFETGNVSAGTLDFNLLVFQADSNGTLSVLPWFFVMINPNTSTLTNVTWTTNLVATYEDVYA